MALFATACAQGPTGEGTSEAGARERDAAIQDASSAEDAGSGHDQDDAGVISHDAAQALDASALVDAAQPEDAAESPDAIAPVDASDAQPPPDLDARAPSDADANMPADAQSADSALCTQIRETVLNDTVTGMGLLQFQYEGTWMTGGGTAKYAMDDHYSSTTNATATLRFHGVGVKFFAARNSNHGIAQLTLDGASPVDIDLYAATRADDREVWSQTGLADADHTLRIVTTGRRNGAASGVAITVDRAIVQELRCDAAEAGP